MDAARWARLQTIFHELADLPPDALQDAIERAGDGDASIVADLRRMLDADRASRSILDASMGDSVRDVLVVTPPERVGPFRILDVLGEGGMGVVYRGVRDDLSSEAALKLLRDPWLSPARRERFLQEQRTLAQLNHPGIAHLLDAGTLDNGTPWIAMELVDGRPITEHVRTRTLGLTARLELLRRTCEGVAHAHRQLVIHRDLKPSNILVRADGTVKLVDFGIAKHLEPDGAGDDATRTGLRLMTPAYASPEQVQGQPVGVQTDVYSLGVVLYELLTGTVPFDVADRTPRDAESLILHADPERPSRRAGVEASGAEWRDLDVLCLTALHKDPVRRYASVEAFARDLTHFLRNEPLEAREDSLAYRTRKFLGRNRGPVTAAAVVLLAIGGLVGFYTVRLARARDAAIAERTRVERIQKFMMRLFAGGDAAAGPAESLKVVTLLDQGRLEARALDREPAVQADLHTTLGGIYRQLGNLDRADSLLRDGLSAWERLRGPASDEVARLTVSLGDLRTDQARYDEADSLLRGAIVRLRAARGRDDAVVAEALVSLAHTQTERGEHERAIALLDTAVAMLAAEVPGTPEHLRGLAEMANARFYAGQYDAADSANQRVLALTRRLYGERHPLVAEDLMNLGATEQERGNYAASERYFREALALTTSFYGAKHYRTAGNLVYLGRSLLLQNRLAESRDALRRALEIREAVYGRDHPAVANTLNELGSLAVREERLDDALAAYDRVLRIYMSAYPGRNFRVGVATGNLGDVYLNRKEYRRAEPLYREALAHYLASQGPDHLNTGIGYIKLGRCLMRSGRFREAEPETQRGYAIVAKVAAPGVNFLQAARLDLSIIYDSLGQRARADGYRAEREKYK